MSQRLSPRPNEDLVDEIAALNAIYTPTTIRLTLTTGNASGGGGEGGGGGGNGAGGDEGGDGGDGDSLDQTATMTATIAPSIYALRLPDTSITLRIAFPSTYPETEPPSILGVESVRNEVDGDPDGHDGEVLGDGGGRKYKHGAGAGGRQMLQDRGQGQGQGHGQGHHAMEILAGVLRRVWRPGEVCLFDALEEFGEEWMSKKEHAHKDEDETRRGEQSVATAIHGSAVEREQDRSGHHQDDEAPPSPIIWHVSSPLVVQKSTFLAHTCRITSMTELAHARRCLLEDRRLVDATHNIAAWRFRRNLHTPGVNTLSSAMSSLLSSSASTSHPPSTPLTRSIMEEDYDDDGEGGAGRQILHLMRMLDVENVLVVVSRWFGGIKLGGRRFAYCVEVAREVLVNAGGDFARGEAHRIERQGGGDGLGDGKVETRKKKGGGKKGRA